MHRLEQADPHHLRDPARVVAVRLVDLLRRQQCLHVPRLDADHRQLGHPQRIDQPLRQRPSLDPDPAVAHAERAQQRDDIGRLGRDLLLQDYLAGIVDNAYRRFLHRHIKTDEMRHLIAPSSMPEAKPTSIQSSSQKGMRTHRPSVSRSRRDTPSVGPDPAILSRTREQPKTAPDASQKHGGRQVGASNAVVVFRAPPEVGQGNKHYPVLCSRKYRATLSPALQYSAMRITGTNSLPLAEDADKKEDRRKLPQ